MLSGAGRAHRAIKHLETVFPLKTVLFILVKPGTQLQFVCPHRESQSRLQTLSEVLAIVRTHGQGVGVAVCPLQDVESRCVVLGRPDDAADFRTQHLPELVPIAGEVIPVSGRRDIDVAPRPEVPELNL